VGAELADSLGMVLLRLGEYRIRGGIAEMSTAEVRRYWSRVSELGCIVCGGPAGIHHPHGGSMKERGIHRSIGRKTSDWLVIPLCPNHHVGQFGIDSGGLTVKQWEQRFGQQADHVDAVCEKLGVDVWARANAS